MINENVQSLSDLGFRTQRELISDKTSSDKLGQDDFLKLMTTQLKNQDPLKPMENGDFLSQMAQFGTVSGIQDLQNSFSSLAQSLYSSQAFQAAGLVGHTVMTSSETAMLEEGSNLNAIIEVPSATSNVSVSMYDQSGQVVRTINLGSQLGGQKEFSWNGLMEDGTRAPAGLYTLRAQANYGGQGEALETLTSSKVDSVSLNPGGGISLNLAEGRTVEFSEVRKIM